jgi:cobalt/nickel transport system ATP-binding protein
MSFIERGYTLSVIFSARELAYGYPGQPRVLDAVDFCVEAGERVGIIGPNGAGKTTFFLLGCGIIKPLSGVLEIMGRPVKPGGFYPEVGMVFQHTSDQLICPSVREDIAFGPQNMGLSGEEIEQRVLDAAQTVCVDGLLNRPPHQLSSGEQRLVSLAGILAMQPHLLILDEPTSDLDMRYRRRLIGLLKSMEDKTMLIASHDLEFVLEVCSRVVLLEGGRFQADGRPDAVMSDRTLMENHGLEVPHSLVTAWHHHRGQAADC